MNYSLYLFDEHLSHPQEIAFMLAQILGLHKIDAIHQVRHAHGCLVPIAPYEKAEKIQKNLKTLGIASFLVPNPNQFHLLRPTPLKRLEITPNGLNHRNQFYPWKQLGTISFGVLGHRLAVEEIVELPAFQNMIAFQDPIARKALKEKVVQDIFQGQALKDQEIQNQHCFLDLLFKTSPPQFFRIRREEVQFHGLQESAAPSSLLNLKWYLEKIVEFSQCPYLTPPTQDFLENPYHPKYFFQSEDHLNRYTRWSFQKFCAQTEPTLETEPTFETESPLNTFPLQEVSNPSERSPLPSRSFILPVEETHALESKLQAVVQEENENMAFPYFLVTFIGHILCVFLLAGLMIVSEMFLAQIGKSFPRGLPFILRESLGIYWRYFFIPILFYVFSEMAFILNLLPKHFRKKYYISLIVLQGLTTLILGIFALILIFK